MYQAQMVGQAYTLVLITPVHDFGPEKKREAVHRIYGNDSVQMVVHCSSFSSASLSDSVWEPLACTQCICDQELSFDFLLFVFFLFLPVTACLRIVWKFTSSTL